MHFKFDNGRCLSRANPEKGEDTIVVPEQIRTIGQYAFSQCRGVKEIFLPDKLVRIERSAFQNCITLEKLHLPKSVTVIGESAFSGCRNLKSIDLPEGLTELAARAFQNCASLEEIRIPDSVLSTGRACFSGCSALRHVTLGENLLLFGEDSFKDCNALQTMELQTDGTVYNAAAAAQTPKLGPVIRIMRGHSDKRMFGRLETCWLAYNGCGYTPLRKEIKSEAVRYLETFLSENRWDDVEALVRDKLISAASFDKTLADFWSPDRVTPVWNYYILKHRSPLALELLKKNCIHCLGKIVMTDDAKTLTMLMEHNWFTKSNIDEMVQIAIDHECVEVQSILLNFKNKEGMYKDPFKALKL